MIFSLKSSDSESGHADQLVECLPSCVCTPVLHQLVMVVHTYIPSNEFKVILEASMEYMEPCL